MANKHILVIDDEHDLLELIEYNLKQSGFTVTTADNAQHGIELAHKHKPRLIILDIMMPGMDGMEACRILKQDNNLSSIPVIFLTAHEDEKTEITSLDIGADDYITKPVSSNVLISRVNAVLRRFDKRDQSAPVIKIRDLEIDRGQYIVRRRNKEYQLPRKEFEILHYLACNPGKVFNRESLLNEIWGDDIFVIDRTVDVHIRKIREKLGDKYIETVKGIGYKFKP